MIPQHERNAAVISGDFSRTKFEIAPADAAHIMTILGSTLYSDKIAAVLREYGTNAFDAHVEANIRDRPISVTLPTFEDRNLSIRDYGHGLSHDDVFGVFKQFGGSTKRESNAVAGMLGIGSKSGWAYRNSFTVISRHDGMRRTYVATAGDAGKPGDISLFAEEICDLDDSGLEIKIAVKYEDVKAFQHKAVDVYKNFSPRPLFNIPLEWNDTKYEYQTADGAIAPALPASDVSTRWCAVMGCVTYPINLQLLKLSNSARFCTGLLKISIGEVDVAASRESLKYSTRTVTYLETKIRALLDAFVMSQIKEINNSATTMWQKRLLSQKLNSIGVTNVTQMFGNLCANDVRFTVPQDMKLYTMSYDKPRLQNRAANYISVNVKTRVVLHDTQHALKRHKVNANDVIFVPKNRKNTDLNKKILTKLLVEIGCDGVPFALTSEDNSVKTQIKRSRKKIYLLNRKAVSNNQAMRKCWIDCVTDVSDSDLRVDIRNFCVDDCKNFREFCKSEAEFAAVYNMPLPRIIGYVNTKKKVQQNKIGTPYLEWRKNFYAYVNQHATKAIQQYVATRYATTYNISNKDFDVLVERLKDHSDSDLVKKVIAVMRQVRDMSEMHSKLSRREEWAMRILDSFTRSEVVDIKHLSEIKERLPLLFAHEATINILSHEKYQDQWIRYIIDTSQKGQ